MALISIKSNWRWTVRTLQFVRSRSSQLLRVQTGRINLNSIGASRTEGSGRVGWQIHRGSCSSWCRWLVNFRNVSFDFEVSWHPGFLLIHTKDVHLSLPRIMFWRWFECKFDNFPQSCSNMRVASISRDQQWSLPMAVTIKTRGSAGIWSIQAKSGAKSPTLRWQSCFGTESKGMLRMFYVPSGELT